MSRGRLGPGPGEGVLYSEVQSTMGNGHMGSPPWTDRHVCVRALSFRNFVGGRYKLDSLKLN